MPDQCEYDVILYYGPPKTSALRGFGFEVATGLVDTQGNNKLGYQIRLILNYEIPAVVAFRRNGFRNPGSHLSGDGVRGDLRMHATFIDKIAAPVASKVFQCGMIPSLRLRGQ